MTPPEVNVRILLAVAVIIGVSRLVGWLAACVGQPRVHGEILAGILLGPSLLGLIWPEALDYVFPDEIVGALKILAQIGLVVFMFLIGLELDLDKLRGHGHKAVFISHASIIVPIGLGSLVAWWLYPRLGDGVDQLGFTLFMGAAMAITAFPVLARVLQETGLYRTRVGVLTVTCAAVDDVTAWCVLAVVVAVVKSTGPLDAVQIIGLSLVFLFVMLRVVRPFLMRQSELPVWAALALALIGAWVTEEIGIHAIFGAFMAGAVVPRRPEIQMEIHDKLETTTLTLLLPIFFVVVGLATRVDMLDSLYLWGITAVVIAAAIAGKWGGSMLAARVTGESWQDAAAIGVLMNTRGLTELVILTVGLELGVITTTVFTIMVLMALVTTLMATPALALVSPLYHRGMTPDEVEPSVDEDQDTPAPASAPAA
ncbi:MAG TPA: cation:proton antiporter [Acidimicrobiales bacterium]|nr:cation:proton antiporter [Acidimicrobiales bacterium]